MNSFEKYPEIKWLLDQMSATGATPVDLQRESIKLHSPDYLLKQLEIFDWSSSEIGEVQ